MEKGETYEITYNMSQHGKSSMEIAEARGLAESTIKGHLVKGIAAGKVSIHAHLSPETIKEVSEILESNAGDIGAIRQENPGKYDYGTLRMVAVYMEKSAK
ncbi:MULTISPECIES: helix-turn-helix domain-containing protein [Rhodonellum]|uniref:helix-turn-helix domain-containing protein n=1 Tax=Rhodonellum TaxID=336827 RepID=UPI0003A8749F|nr:MULTISPECIES: helix-turn-helix domain-containing protein [Rhodonellum]